MHQMQSAAYKLLCVMDSCKARPVLTALVLRLYSAKQQSQQQPQQQQLQQQHWCYSSL
jgi:hypothetical protein